MKNNFAEGKFVHAYGEIKRGNQGLEIIHPDYKFFALHNARCRTEPDSGLPYH